MEKKKRSTKRVAKIAQIKTVKKANEKAKEVGSFITTYKTPILVVSGVFLGLYLIKKTRQGISEALQEESEHIPADLPINATRATITMVQARQFAQQLLDAFNHREPLYGTDEKTVEKVFLQLQNAEDFKLVYKAFALKKYNGWNSPPVSILRYLDTYEPRNLVYWLKSEIKPSDGKVYEIVKARVENAGWIF